MENNLNGSPYATAKLWPSDRNARVSCSSGRLAVQATVCINRFLPDHGQDRRLPVSGEIKIE